MLAPVRLILAVLIAMGPLPAEAREPAFDALSHLINEYAGPVDQKAADAAPEDAAPPGAKLAQVQSDLSLMAEGFEVFRHPSHAAEALKNLPDRIVPELRPFFKDRDSSLDAIYRTLAVTDYTWAARFPDPPCEPKSRRQILLASKDGLFTDPKTGETSAWLARLLGPASKGKDAATALDKASSRQAVSARDYELLRLKVRKISEALESDKAVGAARSKLYCARAQAHEELASAHQPAAGGPIEAARGLQGDSAPADDRGADSVVLIAMAEGPDQYRAVGAGVLVDTGEGPRVLTDARISTASGGESPGLLAFTRPQDGKTLGAPRRLDLVRSDPASGVMLARLDKTDGIPVLKLAAALPTLNDLVRAVGHLNGTGTWTVSQGLVTVAGKGTFTTDALLGPEMLGGPLLNDQGEVLGLAVLHEGASSPVAIAAPRLRELVEGGSGIEASSDIEFVESHNRGSASILTSALPAFGAGLTAPGAKPLEASQYIYTQTQWGTVRGKCMANCGDASPSRGSSYDTGGAELGKALGQAMAPLVEALIFKGIPALFRGIGSLFSKNKTTSSAPSKQAARHETPKAAPPPPEKPKEPARLTGLTIEASPTTAAPGEKVTLTARVTLSDPEAPKGNIPVDFKAVPETLARFDTIPRSKTNSEGIATISATVRRDHGVRAIKTGDTKAAIDKSERAQSDLDDEVRAMSGPSADTAEPGLGREKAESIAFEASANVRKALSATTSVVVSDVPSKPECKFEPVEVPEEFGDEPFVIKVRFSCTQGQGVPDIPLDGHEVILNLTVDGEDSQHSFTLRTGPDGTAFAVFQASDTDKLSSGSFVQHTDDSPFVNAANPSAPVREISEPIRKFTSDPAIQQFALKGGTAAIIRGGVRLLLRPDVGAVILVGGATVAVVIMRKQIRADEKRYEKGVADSKKPGKSQTDSPIAKAKHGDSGNYVNIHIQIDRQHGIDTQRCRVDDKNVNQSKAQEMLTSVRKCGQNSLPTPKMPRFYDAVRRSSQFLANHKGFDLGQNYPFEFGSAYENRIDIEITGTYPYSSKE